MAIDLALNTALFTYMLISNIISFFRGVPHENDFTKEEYRNPLIPHT